MKKKFNEMELEHKLEDGEREQENQSLKEQLLEAVDLKERALSQLKNLESGTLSSQKKVEDEFKAREQELERQLDEKEHEIEEHHIRAVGVEVGDALIEPRGVGRLVAELVEEDQQLHGLGPAVFDDVNAGHGCAV